MDDADALIRACLAAPADQAPRLILADWLDERNDPRGPALRISHDLSFGGLPELKPPDQMGYSGGSRPESRLAARLALIAYEWRTCERRTADWKIPALYLTTCELAACRLIGPKRRDDWLRGPYVKMFEDWPPPRHIVDTWNTRYHRRAMRLMRACGYCQVPFGQLKVEDRPLAHRVMHTARHWIYTRMFEAVKDDRGTWYGYRRFVALPNGRRVHGDKKRGDVATGWQ